MKNKKTLILMWLIAVIPLIIVAVLYPQIPDIIPTHFGLDGTPDAYGSKNTLFILAGFCPLYALMHPILPIIDPRKKNYAKFEKYYDLFGIGMELFFLVVTSFLLMETLRPSSVDIGRGISALMGLLFLFIGNMMGKVKPNYFFGIKTPWTLADPDVWVRTHSLCGKLWFVTGIVLLVAALLLPATVCFIILMVGIVGGGTVSTVLSYIWYKQKEDM